MITFWLVCAVFVAIGLAFAPATAVTGRGK